MGTHSWDVKDDRDRRFCPRRASRLVPGARRCRQETVRARHVIGAGSLVVLTLIALLPWIAMPPSPADEAELDRLVDRYWDLAQGRPARSAPRDGVETNQRALWER